MNKEDWYAVDRYINDQLVPPDPVMSAALEASDAAGMPQIRAINHLTRPLKRGKIKEMPNVKIYHCRCYACSREMVRGPSL